MSDTGSIDYYAEAASALPECVTSAGVTSGWVWLDDEWQPVTMMSMGDGKASVMLTNPGAQ
jgi:hypothetical protein